MAATMQTRNMRAASSRAAAKAPVRARVAQRAARPCSRSAVVVQAGKWFAHSDHQSLIAPFSWRGRELVGRTGLDYVRIL